MCVSVFFVAYRFLLLFSSCQFETVGMVPKPFFDNNSCIYAFVERVIDGDTIRVRHIPAYSWRLWKRRQAPLEKRGIADETLSIRIYGVDCPELAKKKSQTSQPFGEQAKQFTIEFCLHTVVKITLLRKDHYGRALAAVERLPPAGPLLKWVPGLGRQDLSVALAREGLAELYTSGGAEYWVSRPHFIRFLFDCRGCCTYWHTHASRSVLFQDKRESLEQTIADAQQKKLGIWSQGKKRVSAADHKRILRGDRAKEAPSASSFPGALHDLTNSPKAAVAGARGGGVGVAKNNAKNERRSKLLDVAITGLEMVG